MSETEGFPEPSRWCERTVSQLGSKTRFWSPNTAANAFPLTCGSLKREGHATMPSSDRRAGDSGRRKGSSRIQS